MAWTKRECLKFMLNLGGMAAVVGALVLAFFYVYLPATTNHGETITVPNIVGLSEEQLEEFLTQKNLRYEVVPDSGFSNSAEPLTVLKQYPKEYSKVKENRKIYVTLNAVNAPRVKMPNLKDGSLKNAKIHLESLGLKVGKLIYKPDRAENAILEQLYKGKVIKAGRLIPKGSEIDLVVADGIGKDKFELDNYLDTPLDEAMVAIKGANLTIGAIFHVAEVDSLSGLVLKQSPEPGERIREGETVDLWVANYDNLKIVKANTEYYEK